MKPAIMAAAALAMLAGGAGAFAQSEGKASPPASATAAGAAAPEAAAALSVEVERPRRMVWAVTQEAYGRLQAWHEAIIASEIGGQRIESVNADVGSVVRKGDVLVTLSTATVQNASLQQEASVRSAETALAQAQSDANRARNLIALDIPPITQKQLNDALAAEAKARAALDSARAALATSRQSITQTKILAPDDGVISARSAALGMVAGTGAEMFRLIRQSRVEWRAEVPLKAVARLSVGVKAAVRGADGLETPGKIRLISPVSSETTGRVIVYVALTPPDGAPTPRTGELVSGRFELGEKEALTVPGSAILMRDGFTYVFIVEEGSSPPKASRKRVETGRRLEGRVEILSGLDDRARIVRAGGAFLNEGSVVRIVSDAAQEAPK